jgi:hypothetical protein
MSATDAKRTLAADKAVSQLLRSEFRSSKVSGTLMLVQEPYVVVEVAVDDVHLETDMPFEVASSDQATM